MLHSNQTILSVSQLNQKVASLLAYEVGTVWLEAEIGQLTKAASGHWYLTLKDPSAQVRCAMFRQRNRQVSWTPQVGDAVLVKAQVGLYEPRGEYQLVLEAMQPAGLGRLQQAFEQLKKELDGKGWFAQAHKKPLPKTIQRVGLVTSATGAAVHDIISVMQRRDASVELVIYPCQVQGEGAAEQIAQQIKLANLRDEVDLLIVGRGGGSLEDLWSFNTLPVAQAIYESELLVISAVGHDVDVTIADWVADVRAPTPSAAAELVTSGSNERLQTVQVLSNRLHHCWQHQLQNYRLKLSQLEQRLALQSPQYKLQQKMQQADELSYRLSQAIANQLKRANHQSHQFEQALATFNPALMLANQQQKLAHLNSRLQQAMTETLHQAEQAFAVNMAKLDLVSPLATLSRGYSICQKEDESVVRSVTNIEVGETVFNLVSDGQFSATITAVAPTVKE